jgi:hypothetical protein
VVALTVQLLARRVDGIFLSDFEQGEIGPDLFRHACLGIGGHGLKTSGPAPIVPADRRTGSRSRIGRIRRLPRVGSVLVEVCGVAAGHHHRQ